MAQIRYTPVVMGRCTIPEDGQTLIVFLSNREGPGERAIGLDWRDVPNTIALLQNAARDAHEKRLAKGSRSASVEEAQTTYLEIKGYEVVERAEGFMTLSLHAKNGLRFDFALAKGAADPRGTSAGLVGAIGMLLLGLDPRSPHSVQ